jgi:serine/threonine protein kinase
MRKILRQCGIDDVEVVRVLGRGASGQLFEVRVRDRGPDPASGAPSPFSPSQPGAKLAGRRFAMKKMWDWGAEDAVKELEACFRRDFAIPSSLADSPFVVGILGYFPGPTVHREPLEREIGDGTTHYVLMDLCRQDLAALVRERWDDGRGARLGERELLLLLLQLMLAVCDLHDRGIVHRDIKADNVMLSRVGECRLIDFGCAAQSLRPPTREGNPANMPPEVASGAEDAASYDYRGADVWAVGCTVYELLGCGHPWMRRDGSLVPPAQRTEPPPLPDGYPKLSRLAEACLAHDPRRRATPREAVMLIQHLLWDAPRRGDGGGDGAREGGSRGARAWLDALCVRTLSALGQRLSFVDAGQFDFVYFDDMEEQLRLEYLANALRDEHQI